MIVDEVGFRASAMSPRMTGVALAAIGLAVWTVLSVWSGMEPRGSGRYWGEAWNTTAYFFVGVPTMAVAVAFAAFRTPERCWRWPLWLVAGHQSGLLFGGLGMQSGVSLVILAVIIAMLLGVVFAIPAFLGALLARQV